MLPSPPEPSRGRLPIPPGADLRAPGYRREVFQRFYAFHLAYRTHPGLVYLWLPALAEAYDLDVQQRAWLAWLNGNTQNPVTSLLLLEAAPRIEHADRAINLWRERFADLAWDTDRRYQKARFEEATLAFVGLVGHDPAGAWYRYADGGWPRLWAWARSLPHMGRLSAWSMIEFARILLGPRIPDADSLLLDDAAGSRSHRNGLAVVSGEDAAYWRGLPRPGMLRRLKLLGSQLLDEAQQRNPGRWDVGYLSLESALCTYKSWHKPNRRYPNVYADMAHDRLLAAERAWGERFDVLWQSRAACLPAALRLEETPGDPGLVPVKQNQYLETGRVPMLGHVWPEMWSPFDEDVLLGRWGVRTPS